MTETCFASTIVMIGHIKKAIQKNDHQSSLEIPKKKETMIRKPNLSKKNILNLELWKNVDYLLCFMEP